MSRRLTGIFIVALAALTVPVSFAVAGGGGGGAKAVGVERHVDPTKCGVSQGVQEIGNATVSLDHGTLHVNYKLSVGEPGNGYQLYVYDGNCNYVGSLGKFKVDRSGHGSNEGRLNVAGRGRSFYVCDYNSATTYYDCSDMARL